ncbi:MAG: thermonuclease family protein [bacterium]|nr:thermonuclease family protein [bacterium]
MHSGIPERIRLFGIDCPEKNQAFGERAKKETSNLVFGKTVQVTSFSKDKYGRTIGEVLFENTQSLNKLLVSNGYCWWYEKYAPKNAELNHLQQQARAKKLGLWHDKNPIPPWEFRAGSTGWQKNFIWDSNRLIRAVKVYM